ncbi:hypothetical protein NEHOM01_2491, partial [Nematocida homosporus]|uniref:uncharacterized protein n=1 Tax=Nematocida homosporus TaxID=1912981 RepID=UPI00221F6B62
KPYTPVQPTVSDSDTNPCLSSSGLEEKAGLSIVDTRAELMKFIMPKYSSAKEANADLEFLNTIAAIKVSIALIDYTDVVESEWHQTCILIVTRIINMIECKKLIIDLRCNLEYSCTNKPIYDASLREAEKVVGLTPKPPCALVAWGNTILSNWGANAIAIKQQFSSIHLHPIYKLSHRFDKLCLTKDFKTTISLSSTQPNVDLQYLSSIPTNCSEITIKATYKQCPLIVGLGDCTKQYKDIKLLISWDNLRRLRCRSNDKFHVHTIMASDDTYLYLESFSCSEPPNDIEYRIFADKIVIPADHSFPCGFSGSSIYDRIKYTCAEHSVLVKTAEICYKKGRKDFSETLNILEAIDVLPRSAIAPHFGNVCCGNRLKNTEYITIEGPVNIKLVDWDTICDINNIREGLFFCQHIHYTEINIVGSGQSWAGDFDSLTIIQDLFRDITVKKLTIKNVREDREISESYPPKLDKPKKTRYNMNVDVLILDNVSDIVIYWVLGSYNFVKPVKMHILNLNRNSRVIDQLLSDPKARKISELVLDGTTLHAECEDRPV